MAADPITISVGTIQAQADAQEAALVAIATGCERGKQEVIRRIFPTVRDHNWGTLPGNYTIAKLVSDVDRCTIQFRGQVGQPASLSLQVDYEITATELSCDFIAQVHTDFRTNRLGLCILHPSILAGQPCRIMHPDGRRELSAFPYLLAPHQPFTDLAAMMYERSGVSVDLQFSGDVFETEDQRNWIDASYKTYCTPLDRPFPVTLSSGQHIHQRIVARFAPLATTPSVGFLANAAPTSADDSAALAELQPDHLRVDLHTQRDWEPSLNAAAELAKRCKCELMVAVYGDIPKPIRMLQQHLADGAKVSWLLVLGHDRRLPAAELALAARAAGWSGPIAVGSDANFVELNRHHWSELRTLQVAGTLQGVFFAANPQVHAFGRDAILETPDGLGACCRTARWLGDGLAVLVTPLTFRPRFNAVATDPNAQPPPPDERQQSDWAGQWLVESIKSAALNGATLVTTFEAFGDYGIVQQGRLTNAGEVLRQWLRRDK